MDLLSPADRVTDIEAEHEPLTLWASIVMWFTVLLPYVGLLALVVWTLTLPYNWLNLGVFAVCYLLIGFGVTVGYHRLLAHKAFTTHEWISGTFLVLGCMAMQGPPIRWAATHRRHHQKADLAGDPHSPHTHGEGAGAVLRGLWHAHTGWLLTPDPPQSFRSVKDLLRNPMVRFIDRYYVLWLALSVLIPFSVGLAVTGSWLMGAACVFWGVVVRMALMHHATWSVNSICHFFGYRSYDVRDESRNNPIIAVLSLGEGWHNNHHAFPTSARHGMAWYEFDPSYMLILVLEKLGLAWNVRRPAVSARESRNLVEEVHSPAR